MSALSARVAVVPGRNVIGIELPNPVRETVYLRELIETPDYAETRYKLPVCLGKTIGGEPVIAELRRCRICSWPAPPVRASRSRSTR